ncbi:MAG: DUF1501 domain-containing protein [Planctomycetales bacterium]|nr:DUF1501 domain-containing protein [Planctomycetales bacterium]
MPQNVFNPMRRRLLKSLSAGLFTYGLGDLLTRQQLAVADATRRCEARNVLVIYEEGGISQMDSWDPKPDAPVDHRSPFAPIATTVPGTFFSSLMPQIAQHAHRLSVVRSMTSTRVAGHIEGCLEFMKGYRFDSPLFQGNELRSHRFPDIGSVVTDRLGSERAELPGYILCPGANLPNHVGNSGFLPKSCAPWKLGTRSLGEDVAAPGWRVKSLDPLPGLNSERLRQRESLLSGLDAVELDRTAVAAVLRDNYERAFDLLASPQVQQAFSFDSEKPETLERYGLDHRGMCYLLGRKLIEADVRFVTVTVIQPSELVGRRNNGEPNGAFLNWDHHEGIYRNGPCGGPQSMANGERYGLPHPVMMPSLDRSLSALLEDMDQRGLLAETLVCFITEMGRTPRLNKWQGRDHWARAMSVAFAGAGVPGGQVIGETDREAADVISQPYTPYDYAETIYRKLGIDTNRRLMLPDGRPVEFTDGGRPISELFA